MFNDDLVVLIDNLFHVISFIFKLMKSDAVSLSLQQDFFSVCIVRDDSRFNLEVVN